MTAESGPLGSTACHRYCRPPVAIASNNLNVCYDYK